MAWSSFAGIATVVAIACLLPASAGADPPLTDRFPVDAEFDYPPLTDECGFPVTIAFEGTFQLKLFTRKDGTAREIDTQPSTKVTFRSANGSVTQPFSATLHTSYPEGTAIGAPAFATLTGRSFGAGIGRGRLELVGTVEDVEDGIPLVRFGDAVSSSGNFAGDTAKICAALA